MKAAVFHELGQPLAIENVAKPQAGPGEIVLKVHYCGICGSDLHSTHPGVTDARSAEASDSPNARTISASCAPRTR
jgi:D-arabinose 1-dehydrogenase-like Zn-dependent alcohol dehydrogenase